ncbi:MAG TPA: hypothetical protein VFS29_12520 [Motilibacteraceae bacterium]|nr:hypothetical protein [Motilibacteraceae bacterium]
MDYGDEDHAFRVTVEVVPRQRWMPRQPLRVGQVDGVDVELVGVSVDNYVHVRLGAADTAERDRLTRVYTDAWERWAATARETTAGPPDKPAELLGQVSVRVADELGTLYGPFMAEVGMDGAEWMLRRSFGPRPPVDVHELRLTLQAPGQSEVSVSVALSRVDPSSCTGEEPRRC